MPDLLFICHSQPEPDTSIPASDWRLSHRGRQLCMPLAQALRPYAPAALVSSVAPKAVETARLLANQLGISSEIAFGLHEHDRSNMPYLPQGERFEARLWEMFAKPEQRVFGLESADEAQQRFAAAVDGLLAQNTEGTIGIVAHGTVISLLVARANGLEPFEFWQRLTMPCAVLLTCPDLAFKQLIQAGASAS